MGYSFTISGTGHTIGTVSAYSGVDATSPLDGTATSTFIGQTSITASSVSPTQTNGRLMVAVGASGTPTATPADGLTERYDDFTPFNPVANRVAEEGADQALSASGSTGTRTVTLSAAADAVTFSVVLRAASSGTSHRYGYGGPGDSASLIQDGAGLVLGRVFVLPGGVVYQKNSTGNRWSAPNVHGDVMAITDQTGTKLGATFTWDPYGQPLAGTPDSTPGNLDLGWVGRFFGK